MFVNIRCKIYSLYTPVGDSRLPSAVTDLFTIKILNSLHVETLSANRYRTTKERVAPCYQWSYHLRGEYSKSDSHQLVCQCQEDEEDEFCVHVSCFFLSSARFRRCIVDNAFLNSGWYLVGTESKCATFVWIHQLPRYRSISSLVALCGPHLQADPSL